MREIELSESASALHLYPTSVGWLTPKFEEEGERKGEEKEEKEEEYKVQINIRLRFLIDYLFF